MYNPGCGGPDSNRESPAYEAGELPISLPRNGCTRRIRTSSLGYEPSELPLLHQCDIEGIFFGSEPSRPRMKGNENRSSGWHSGQCNSFRFMTLTKRNIIFDYPA